MGVALKLYEQLTDAGEDKARARLIAEAFERLEERYPELKEVATQGHVRESELRLKLEIEGVRLEIREAEGRLQKEIESVRLEIKEVEGRLQKEIEGVRLEIREAEGRLQKEIKEAEGRLKLDIEGVRLEIKGLEVKMTASLHRHTLWVVSSVGAIIGLIRLMDFFLHAGVTH
ncbi:MAG: hypothetical protein WC091_05810 [Sulfuricellaceae bacterium]